ncbi:MAG: hypothetical protein RQ723_00330 [Desulfuromonadales bacterium]|nr:hypothetical protein [Desulfuromonadales bacterium]
MPSLPITLYSVTRQLHHWLRAVAYDDMARQASGWVPDHLRVKPPVAEEQPLRLDISVGRKSRLGWAQRRANHLPH